MEAAISWFESRALDMRKQTLRVLVKW